jgi:hypothetical protein
LTTSFESYPESLGLIEHLLPLSGELFKLVFGFCPVEIVVVVGNGRCDELLIACEDVVIGLSSPGPLCIGMLSG